MSRKRFLLFGSTAGYLWLDTWVIANVIQLATTNFCTKFLNRNNDPDDRQRGQMTQAARSVTASIAEGSSRHQTSYETEMKLIDVARAIFLIELLGDGLRRGRPYFADTTTKETAARCTTMHRATAY